ncbi:MAG: hypothetical protein K2G78_03995, partial [Muribaculaceae bacterium]|nr:hypothetical protein [Muribaculaceae bacterium]
CMEVEEVMQRIRLTSDPMEGIWRVIDWSLNTSLAMKGGDYRLATVRRPDGCYEIIYLGGAATLADGWEEGGLKGELHPTGVSGTYTLFWRDAEGEALAGDLTAQYNAANKTLTLNFPHLESTIRLIQI